MWCVMNNYVCLQKRLSTAVRINVEEKHLQHRGKKSFSGHSISYYYRNLGQPMVNKTSLSH